MSKYNKITALYSRLSDGDEDRDGGESNSIKNQRAFLEHYAGQQKLTNIKHYVDDDEIGRFFDRSGYVQMMEDVEGGKRKKMTSCCYRWWISFYKTNGAARQRHCVTL